LAQVWAVGVILCGRPYRRLPFGGGIPVPPQASARLAATIPPILGDIAIVWKSGSTEGRSPFDWGLGVFPHPPLNSPQEWGAGGVKKSYFGSNPRLA